MKVKLIKKSTILVVWILLFLHNACIAQDTITAVGLRGKIIRNPSGTFFYTNKVQLQNNECINTYSYGRWTMADDGTISFISSSDTKQTIVKCYSMFDTISKEIVDIYDEHDNLLCKKIDSTLLFYAGSSIFDISTDDDRICIHGINQYGQWQLCRYKEKSSNNHYVIYIRDAFYYDLEYLRLTLKKENNGYIICSDCVEQKDAILTP